MNTTTTHQPARSKRFLSIGATLTVLDALAAPLVLVLVLGVSSPLVLTVAAATAALTARAADVQRSRLVLTIVEDLPRLLVVSAFTLLVVSALSPTLGASTSFSLPMMTAGGAGLFALLTMVRSGVYLVATVLRRSGTVSHPVVIVGADKIGARLAQSLRDRPGHGLTPVGVVSTGGADEDLSLFSIPSLGEPSELAQIMADHQIDDVIFSGTGSDASILVALRRCIDEHRQVFVVPRFHELVSTERHRRTELVRDIVLTRLRRTTWRPTAPALSPVTTPAQAPVGDLNLEGRRPARRTLAAVFTGIDERHEARQRELAGTAGWTEIGQVRRDTSATGHGRYRNSYRQNLALTNELRSVAETHPARTKAAPAKTALPAMAAATPHGVEKAASVLPRVANTWGRETRRPAPHRVRTGVSR